MSKEPLSSAHLTELLTTFKKEYGAEYHLGRLGFFGSYARDEATPESDVDIVFDTDRPNLFQAARLREELEAFLGRPVDIVQLRGLSNPRLRARVEKEAVYV